MIEHVVAVSVQVPDSVTLDTVQSIVLAAVARVDIDRFALSVTGVDLAKLEAEKAKLIQERDEYRKGWLEGVAALKDAAVRLAALEKKLEERFSSPQYKREGPLKKHEYSCAECGTKTRDDYMLDYAVWEKVAKSDEVLHLECLTKRLGRPLAFADFPDVPSNRMVRFLLSEFAR